MHSETTATITATEITQTGYSYFTHVQIDQSLHPTGSMLSIILCLWGFLCIRDAGPSPSVSYPDKTANTLRRQQTGLPMK